MKKLLNKPTGLLGILLINLLLNACQQDCLSENKLSAAQPWVLNREYSSISIISTKNNKISEVSNFEIFSGKISSTGYLQIEINLNSLETNIPIRNERMQKHLFHTELYPTVDIHTQLKPEDLSIGVHNISFDVDLHGVSAMLQAEFMVFEQFGNKVITLHKPLIIKAETFGLEDGIKTLKNIAKLQSIDFTVPVNLILNFQVQKK